MPSPHRSDFISMESAATPYPVVFFDGEEEHENGFITIHSGLTFKRFRALLSQRSGVPPTHLSVAFIFPAVQRGIEKRQRLPINGNTNFSILLKQHNPSKERDCCFIVALRKSRKDRRGCRKRGVKDGWDRRPAMDDALLTEERNHVGNESCQGDEQRQDPTVGPPYVVDAPCLPAPFNARFLGDLPQYSPMQITGTLGDGWFGRSMYGQSCVTSSLHTKRWTHTDQPVSMQGYMLSPRFAAVRKEDNEGFEWYLQDNLFGEKNREFNLQPPTPHFNSHLVCERDASESQHLTMHKFKDSLAQGPNWGARDSDRVLTLSASKAGPRLSRITALPDGLNVQPNFQHIAVCPSEAQHELCCQVCSDCKSKKIFPVPFHWCVEDTVTTGFRGPSPAGPIGRPKTMLPCGTVVLTRN